MAEDDRHEEREELARLTAALRRVVDRVVGTTAPPEVFGDVAERLERLAERLGEHEQDAMFGRYLDAPGPDGITPFSPIIGRLHPFSPPVRLTVVGPHVEGVVTFGTAFEGPPGHVHGGFVAATLDELLGMTTAVQRLPAMTGRLTVRYRRPTPLHTELRVSAEVKRVDKRKVYVEGRIERPGGEVCAEADGLFLAVDFTRLARGERLPGAGPAVS